MSQKVLLSEKEIHIILHRLACQLLENHLDFSNTVLIGLQPRGTFLASRLIQILQENYKVKDKNGILRKGADKVLGLFHLLPPRTTGEKIYKKQLVDSLL